MGVNQSRPECSVSPCLNQVIGTDFLHAQSQHTYCTHYFGTVHTSETVTAYVTGTETVTVSATPSSSVASSSSAPPPVAPVTVVPKDRRKRAVKKRGGCNHHPSSTSSTPAPSSTLSSIVSSISLSSAPSSSAPSSISSLAPSSALSSVSSLASSSIVTQFFSPWASECSDAAEYESACGCIYASDTTTWISVESTIEVVTVTVTEVESSVVPSSSTSYEAPDPTP
ncbi:hypothetical protein B0T16DRAFT_171042 [Cercophora newfieldiana]|uniref:Uncharacterized protein n=1 Tax=Cercophora newfieldiana TaxID=92897 RepID=A0AA40CQH2_9PEZI|nr:hypothetical protein B0T16DRAFT_171042 [Cercophora newfieldiana]